jgi:hypothetical protein
LDDLINLMSLLNHNIQFSLLNRIAYNFQQIYKMENMDPMKEKKAREFNGGAKGNKAMDDSVSNFV